MLFVGTPSDLRQRSGSCWLTSRRYLAISAHLRSPSSLRGLQCSAFVVPPPGQAHRDVKAGRRPRGRSCPAHRRSAFQPEAEGSRARSGARATCSRSASRRLPTRPPVVIAMWSMFALVPGMRRSWRTANGSDACWSRRFPSAASPRPWSSTPFVRSSRSTSVAMPPDHDRAGLSQRRRIPIRLRGADRRAARRRHPRIDRVRRRRARQRPVRVHDRPVQDRGDPWPLMARPSRVEWQVARWARWYNTSRLHSSIGHTPAIEFQVIHRRLRTVTPNPAVPNQTSPPGISGRFHSGATGGVNPHSINR